MKNTLVIDLDRCSGCDSCVAACKMENQMNLGVVRNHVSAIGPTGTFPDIEMYWLPMQCQQCENPGCIEVCPTGASYRDEETGIVLVNAEDCIGCESCLTGCPYGVRQLNPKTNTIEKCTLCFQRKNDENWVPLRPEHLEIGQQPPLGDPERRRRLGQVGIGVCLQVGHQRQQPRHLFDRRAHRPPPAIVVSRSITWRRSSSGSSTSTAAP